MKLLLYCTFQRNGLFVFVFIYYVFYPIQWNQILRITEKQKSVCVCVCVCVCARIVTDDIDMITHHVSGDIATTDDVIGS